MANYQTEQLVSQLSIFQKTPVLISVANNFVEEVETKTTLNLTNTSNLQFTVPASPTLYTDLSSTFLYLRAKLVKADGSAIGAADKVGPINNVLGSLIKSCDHYINDVRVSSSYDCYTYLSFLENFMSSFEQKQMKEQAGYFEDTLATQGAMNSTDTSANGPNKGLVQRASWFSGSREVELIDQIYTPAHSSTKYYLPFLSFDYNFTLNSNLFALMFDLASDYRFQITKATLLVKRIAVSPSVSIAHSQLLNSNRANYQVRRYGFSQFSIPQGSFTFSKVNLFISDVMPKQVIFLFVPTANLLGAPNRNPLFFFPQNLATINLRVGEINIPNSRFTADYAANIYKKLYLQTLEGMGAISNQSCPANFTPAIFKETMGIFMYDLTRDSNPTGEYVNSYYDKHTIQLEGSFASALSEAVTVLAFGIYLSNLQIDSQYVPSTDY